ncbi:hypothetical protein GOODEAATRI_003495 [Goodea atripinnis]|uniref:Anaphase-promoting complex subunit 4-like WD40 domain-containing protein n=1 Tax=Goodea atripinnis TaxID=208336 RepID=A0ABV0NHJ7_9TELE
MGTKRGIHVLPVLNVFDHVIQLHLRPLFMGLTKQYLRYAASAVFGVIGSQRANITYVTLRGGEKGRYVAVAACEHVFIWDVRKGEKVLILQGQKHEVSFLCPSPDGVHIAVGYEDGVVRIFNLLNGESNVSFNGHKSGVTVMSYDALGARLVTGSKVWGMVLLNKEKKLLTGSADSELRAWDISYLEEEDAGEQTAEPVVERTLKDEIIRLTNIKASAKIRWVDVQSCAGGELKVALLLQNNTVETYSLKTSDRNPTANKTARLTLGGHRTDVRTLAFSSDSLAVLSASGDTVKVIRTMACEYALCSLFVPGDRQIILGTKGHHREVWCLAISPNGDHLVSSSHDKSLRLWERTREPIILEEEREMGKGSLVPGETEGEAAPAGKKSIETVKAVSLQCC